MINEFKLKIYIPSLENKIYFSELKNYHLINILKFITNKDSKGLSNYFDFVIINLLENKELFNSLDVFDKLIILLQLKAINVNSELKFKISSSQSENRLITFDLFKEIKTLTEHKLIKSKEIEIENNFFIRASIPRKLFIENFDDIFNHCIKLFKINEETFIFEDLEEKMKDRIFESISGEHIQKIFSFLEEVNNSCNEITFLSSNSYINDLNNLKLNFFNNSILNFLEVIYSEDLKNVFELMYVITSKLNISITDFYNQIPSESLLMYALYEKEIKHQNEEIEKSTKSPGVPLQK
jgi:hypothetical protein